jgi:hypothetical protein
MEYNGNRDASPRQGASFETMSKNGTSMFSSRAGTRRKKDPIDEAMLLSKATSQAMIAARSIVMSGGSQQTALSTAKAAAQSILAPHISDTDTVGTAGQSFLGRRKGKRQAEIVASMALLSVNNSLQQFQHGTAPSQQWDASMLVQPSPPSQVVQKMHSPVDDESLTVASNSLIAERQESFRKMPYAHNQKPSDKYSHARMQRESSSKHAASRELAGRDRSEIRATDSRRPSPSKGRDTRLIESPSSKRLPPLLARNQSRVKDVAVTEPIYTSNVLERKKRVPVPLSYSTSGDDDSTAGDGETTNSWNADTADTLLAAKRTDKGFLQQNVDPLLFSITSAFNCGFSPSSTIVAAKNRKKERRQFRDDDEEDGDSDEDDINETRESEGSGDGCCNAWTSR